MPELRRRLHRLLRSRPRPDGSVVLWGVAFVLALLFVWKEASVDRIVMQLETEQRVPRELQSEVNALAMEADQLSSLAQVERRAERELGLIRPGTDQIVSLRFEGAPEASPRFSLDPLVPEATAGPREEDPPR